MNLCRAFSPFVRVFNLPSNSSRCMSFKSHLSLDNLYPDSVNPKPFEPPVSENGKFSGYIPIKNLEITYSKSSGAGGQHVQKTDTKVDVRFHVEDAKWLSEATKAKLIEEYYTRINKNGYFIIKSEKTRSRVLNLADALNRIREIIFKLEEHPPEIPPEVLEKHRKNIQKAARIRIMEKKMRAIKRAERKGSVRDYYDD